MPCSTIIEAQTGLDWKGKTTQLQPPSLSRDTFHKTRFFQVPWTWILPGMRSPCPLKGKSSLKVVMCLHVVALYLNFSLNLAITDVIINKNVQYCSILLHSPQWHHFSVGFNTSWVFLLDYCVKQKDEMWSSSPTSSFHLPLISVTGAVNTSLFAALVYGLIWKTQQGLPRCVCYHVWGKGLPQSRGINSAFYLYEE